MRPIDERAEIIRPSIEMRRREQVDAVIPPPETAVELGNRHHFHDGDPEPGQFLEFRGRGRPGPLLRKGACMKLVQDLTLQRDTIPSAVGPRKPAWIDDL